MHEQPPIPKNQTATALNTPPAPLTLPRSSPETELPITESPLALLTPGNNLPAQQNPCSSRLPTRQGRARPRPLPRENHTPRPPPPHQLRRWVSPPSPGSAVRPQTAGSEGPARGRPRRAGAGSRMTQRRRPGPQPPAPPGQAAPPPLRGGSRSPGEGRGRCQDGLSPPARPAGRLLLPSPRTSPSLPARCRDARAKGTAPALTHRGSSGGGSRAAAATIWRAGGEGGRGERTAAGAGQTSSARRAPRPLRRQGRGRSLPPGPRRSGAPSGRGEAGRTWPGPGVPSRVSCPTRVLSLVSHLPVSHPSHPIPSCPIRPVPSHPVPSRPLSPHDPPGRRTARAGFEHRNAPRCLFIIKSVTNLCPWQFRSSGAGYGRRGAGVGGIIRWCEACRSLPWQ